MIRIYLKYIFFIFFALFVQSALSKAGMLTPDLLLVVVIALAFSVQNAAGVVSAFFLGLLSDLASGVYLGPFAASYVCAFCFAGMISRRVFADRLIAVMSVAFISSLVKTFVFCIFVFSFVPNSTGLLFNFRIFITEAIITSLISPIVFRVFLGKFSGKTQNRSSLSLSFSRAAK